MNIHHKARHLGVVGKSGMGKTTYALRYAQGSHHARVFVYDHQGEFAGRFNAPEVATNFDQLAELAERERLCVFDPVPEWGGNFAEGFDLFCSEVHRFASEAFCPLGLSTLFVCDEIQRFCKIGSVPPSFKLILETGRRSMLDSLVMSQRPNKIDADVREQWTEIIFFRLSDVNSLKFIEDAGAEPDAVAGLAPHHFSIFFTERSESREGLLQF